MSPNGDASTETGASSATRETVKPALSSRAVQVTRLQRSVTDSHIATTKEQDVESRMPGRAVDAGSRPAHTAVATSKSSYFDTYQPYKLNPALTPSIKSSRSRSEKDLRAARQKSMGATTPSKTSTPAESVPNVRSEKSQQLKPAASNMNTDTESIDQGRQDGLKEARKRRETGKSGGALGAAKGENTISTPLRKTHAESIESWRQVASQAVNRTTSGYDSNSITKATSFKTQPVLMEESKETQVPAGVSAGPSKTVSSASLTESLGAPTVGHPESPSRQAPQSVHSYRQLVAQSRRPLQRTTEKVLLNPHESSSSDPSKVSLPSIETREHHTTLNPIPAQFSTGPKDRGTHHTNMVKTHPAPEGVASGTQSARPMDDVIKEYPSRQQRLSPSKSSGKQSTSPRSGQLPTDIDHYESDDSVDSITREVQCSLWTSSTTAVQQRRRRNASLAGQRGPNSDRERDDESPRLHHASSFHESSMGRKVARKSRVEETPPLPIAASSMAHRSSDRPSTSSSHQLYRHRNDSGISTASLKTSASDLGRPVDHAERFTRSPRLNQVVEMSRTPNEGLQVSFADVGHPHGHPVLVYLGLGAVRYLAGLYDDLATALRLRLICIDRWGIGRTADVPNERRGLLEWASVVEEVVDLLEISTFSLLAHSAGAPYAMAMALLNPGRVLGPIHLLAPWVNPEVDSSYRWLKYVPEQLIRTAQAAEWRMASWKLGKRSEPDDLAAERPARPSDSAPSLSISGSTRALHSPQGVLTEEAGDLTPSTTLPRSKASLFTPLRTSGMDTPLAGMSDAEGRRRSAMDGTEESNARTEESNATYRPPGSVKAAPTTSAIPSFMTSFYEQGLADRDDLWQNRASMSMDLSRASGVSTSASARERQHRQYATGTSLRTTDGFGLSSAAGEYDLNRHLHPSSSSNDHLQGPTLSSKSRLSQFGQGNEPATNLSRLSAEGTVCGGGGGGTTTMAASSSSSVDTATSLLRASHAESLRAGGAGTTADLMTILGGRKPWGFTYKDISHKVKVWHGEKDERIGLGGALWMERECRDVQLKIVKGANHGLMTNTAVVIEALESIAMAAPL